MKISREAWTITIISAVFVIIIGLLVWKSPGFTSSTTPVDQTLLVHPANHMTGTLGAKVTLVEFGDYQCPACGAAYPAIKQAVDAYKTNSNFNFVFRNFPLPQHANALIAAEAAEAAGAQGKYWEMHDALYTNQNEWAESSDPLSFFVKYATAIGLDANKFKSDVSANKYKDVISADQSDDTKLGLDHTPTVFLNGVEATDLSVAGLKAKIDPLLAK